MNQSTVPEKKDQNAFIAALKFQNLEFLKFVILKFWCYKKYIKFYPHIVTHKNFKCPVIMHIVRHMYY
jgi:hypothetical protein